MNILDHMPFEEMLRIRIRCCHRVELSGGKIYTLTDGKGKDGEPITVREYLCTEAEALPYMESGSKS